MIPKSDDTKAGMLQNGCSLAVYCDAILVLSAVNFYNEFLFKAYKIENKIFVRMLSSEFQALQLLAS